MSGPDELLAEVEHWLDPKGDYPHSDATLGLVKIALMVRIRDRLAANAALAARCERAEARFGWCVQRMSGRAWREAGIEYSEPADIEPLIDGALASQAEGER